VHASIETVFTGAYHQPLQPANHDIHDTFHARVTEDSGRRRAIQRS
jgi:hypothetical protein